MSSWRRRPRPAGMALVKGDRPAIRSDRGGPRSADDRTMSHAATSCRSQCGRARQSTSGEESDGEVAGEGFLLVGFDRTFAVCGSDPADGVVWRLAAEDGKASQRGTGATMAAVTADLDALTGPGPVKQRLERSDNRNWIAGDTEVRPVEVVVGPRRPPPLVEVQPKIGRHVAGI